MFNAYLDRSTSYWFPDVSIPECTMPFLCYCWLFQVYCVAWIVLSL